MDAIARKIKITESMLGQDAFILTEPEKNSITHYGGYIALTFHPGIDERSLKQNGLYWKCLEIIAEQKADNPDWNTKRKVNFQVKNKIRFIDPESVTHITMPDGTQRLYFEYDSISFSRCDRVKANEFFEKAFPAAAEFIGLQDYELIAEAKNRMKARRVCRECGTIEKITGHHKLSQTKLYRELYPEFIDHPDNKIFYCIDCHENKPIEKWTEKEFCEHFGIEIRSKSGVKVESFNNM